MNVKKHFDSGNANFLEEKYIEAITDFRKGLDELGNCYSSPGLLDHTGMRLLLAKMEERDYRFDNAARLLKETLNERLYRYQQLKDSAPQCEKNSDSCD
ncbi:MAG TPA: hypothetical protein VGP06_19590 [Janthinobacterium sp.]|jgi:hypothetical protein|nr:hypothetical protein [Janthinobacterium sp.]